MGGCMRVMHVRGDLAKGERAKLLDSIVDPIAARRGRQICHPTEGLDHCQRDGRGVGMKRVGWERSGDGREVEMGKKWR